MISSPYALDAAFIDAAIFATKSRIFDLPVEDCALQLTRLQATGKWNLLLNAAAEAVADNPESPTARTAVVHALSSLGARGRAAVQIRVCLALSPNSAEGWRTLALLGLQTGETARAQSACRHALNLLPLFPEALATLAVVRMTQGLTELARALFRAAVVLSPDLAECWGNAAVLAVRANQEGRGLRLAARAVRLKPFLVGPRMLSAQRALASGRLDEAESYFQSILATEPHNIAALTGLAELAKRRGVSAEPVATACRKGLEASSSLENQIALAGLLYACGDAAGALGAYLRLADEAPQNCEANFNAGALALAHGRNTEGVALLRRAHAVRPDAPVIAVALAGALLDVDDADPAATVLASALRRHPDDASVLNLFGRTLCRLNRSAEGAAAFREALRHGEETEEGSASAVSALLNAGRPDLAAPFARRLIVVAPHAGRSWTFFAQTTRFLQPPGPDADLEADLLLGFERPGAEKAYLANAALALLRYDPAFSAFAAAATKGETNAAPAERLGDPALQAFVARPLTLAVLDAVVVADSGFEAVLTALRRALCAQADGGGEAFALPCWTRFICALARQCWLNEFIYDETAAETAQVEQLEKRLGDLLDENAPIPDGLLGLYAAYRPLAASPLGARLSARIWNEDGARLIERQVRTMEEELEIRAVLPRLTPVSDPVSQAVRDQYEQNPHPRWLHAALLDAPAPVPAVVRSILPHVRLDAARWAAPEILIAGCGTGRESVWAANCFAGAKVTAVDVSLASLAYAARQTRRLGVGGVDYAQADLLALADLDGWRDRFDMIQSVGVLHHTGDIAASWRALLPLLKPDGLMKIGLYSKIARRSVTSARALIRQHGFPPTLDGVRKLRALLRAKPDDHPAAPVTRSVDYHSTSACRDLLFHEHEICIDLNDLQSLLDRLDLEFLGFEFETPQMIADFRTRFGRAAALDDLKLWRTFEDERSEIFGALYQFWTRRRS
jgi:predicted Zn-dependent protease/SAM-dependent methyltransferase